jgi:uncharacterized protein
MAFCRRRRSGQLRGPAIIINMDRRLPILVCLVLSTAIALPATAIAQQRTVAVNGSVTQQVPNDAAGLGFSVSKSAGSRAAALELVSEHLRAVIAVVQAAPGVGATGVSTGQISLRRVHRAKRVIYLANEGINVITTQPLESGELISAALRAGATAMRGPTFFIGNSELAYSQALAAAFAQAKARATTLASQAGVSVGQVLNIEEGGGVAITPPASEKASPGCTGAVAPTKAKAATCAVPSPPVSPGTSTVTATVHVVFELQ